MLKSKIRESKIENLVNFQKIFNVIYLKGRNIKRRGEYYFS